jgi:hypothetical protein
VSTHKTVKISERAELRKKAWTVLAVIRLIKNFRTGTASIKWVKAQDEDQWNKKADELAKCGAQGTQMSGVHYNVMNDQKYAYQVEDTTDDMKIRNGGVIISGDICRHITHRSKTAAIAQLVEKWNLSPMHLQFLLKQKKRLEAGYTSIHHCNTEWLYQPSKGHTR